MKRLGIFVFFDKNGFLDDYKVYFLKELKKNVERLEIVINGIITDSGLKILQEFGNVTIRSNEGFDITAYKENIARLGQENIEQYDELVLCNDTVFGPLYPFQEVFDEMASREADFWGLTKGYADILPWAERGRNISFRDHIHSYFLVIRKPILEDIRFYDYFRELPEIKSYLDAVFIFEVNFTNDLVKMGYQYDILVDTEPIRHNSTNLLAFMPLELVRDFRCPIVKRRYFYSNLEDYSTWSISNMTSDIFKYIKEQTEYNENFIWQTILRNGQLFNIWKQMRLTSIFDENLISSNNLASTQKFATFIHIYRTEMADELLERMSVLPSYTDVYITTNTKEKATLLQSIFEKEDFNQVITKVSQNRGRGESAFLIEMKEIVKDYDVVCLMHDKDSPNEGSSTPMVSKGFSYKIYDNLLHSKAYVLNILDSFAKNPRLGILTPPEPNHSFYDSAFADLWTVDDNFTNTTQLLEQLGCTIKLDRNEHPFFTIGGMFYFRPAALEKIFDKNWTYDDFPSEPIKTDGTILHAIERSYAYIAQDNGYYSAIIMNNDFAELEYGNLKYNLMTVYRTIRKEVQKTGQLGTYTLPVHLELLFDSPTSFVPRSHRIGMKIANVIQRTANFVRRIKRRILS